MISRDEISNQINHAINKYQKMLDEHEASENPAAPIYKKIVDTYKALQILLKAEDTDDVDKAKALLTVKEKEMRNELAKAWSGNTGTLLYYLNNTTISAPVDDILTDFDTNKKACEALVQQEENVYQQKLKAITTTYKNVLGSILTLGNDEELDVDNQLKILQETKELLKFYEELNPTKRARKLILQSSDFPIASEFRTAFKFKEEIDEFMRKLISALKSDINSYHAALTVLYKNQTMEQTKKARMVNDTFAKLEKIYNSLPESEKMSLKSTYDSARNMIIKVHQPVESPTNLTRKENMPEPMEQLSEPKAPTETHETQPDDLKTKAQELAERRARLEQQKKELDQKKVSLQEINRRKSQEIEERRMKLQQGKLRLDYLKSLRELSKMYQEMKSEDEINQKGKQILTIRIEYAAAFGEEADPKTGMSQALDILHNANSNYFQDLNTAYQNYKNHLDELKSVENSVVNDNGDNQDHVAPRDEANEIEEEDSEELQDQPPQVPQESKDQERPPAPTGVTTKIDPRQSDGNEFLKQLQAEKQKAYNSALQIKELLEKMQLKFIQYKKIDAQDAKHMNLVLREAIETHKLLVNYSRLGKEFQRDIDFTKISSDFGNTIKSFQGDLNEYLERSNTLKRNIARKTSKFMRTIKGEERESSREYLQQANQKIDDYVNRAETSNNRSSITSSREGTRRSSRHDTTQPEVTSHSHRNSKR